MNFGEVIIKINPVKSPVESIACNIDNRTLIVGQAATELDTPTLSMIDINNGEVIKTIEKSSNFNNSVWKLLIDKTGEYIVYLKQLYNGDNRYNIVIYNIKTEEKTVILDVENNDQYKSLIITPENKLVIGIDNTIQFWNIEHKERIEVITINEEKDIDDPHCYLSLAFTSDNHLMAIGGLKEEQILIFDLVKKEIINRVSINFSFPRSIQFNNTDKYLFIADYWQGGFYVWSFDESSFYLDDMYNDEMELITTFALNKNGNNEWLSVGMKTSIVKIINSFEGKTLFKDKIHTGRISSVIFTPDNKKLISAGEDGQIIIRNVEVE